MKSHIERYFVEGLAHASYLVINGPHAVVVDPKRDIDDYIAFARSKDSKIVAILNTHPHADFASGFQELASLTGASIHTSHFAPVTYDHTPSRDGDIIKFEDAQIRILETPGHSPDSLSFLLEEDENPVATFTGDLLFVGDVGRPDLRDADEDPNLLAKKLYDSLFNKVMNLPDEVLVYPAHGAGSLCGRAISSTPFSTVGDERSNNWALQIKDENIFVQEMVSNLPDRPAYFSYDVGVNIKGASPLSELPPLKGLNPDEVSSAAEHGAVLIDTRTAGEFGAGHLPGSLNIGIQSHMFSTWVGFLVDGNASMVLVLSSDEDKSRVQLELARIGFDNIVGVIIADELPDAIDQMTQVSACDLREWMRTGQVAQMVDVRTCGERKAIQIEESKHIPLPTLANKQSELDPRKTTVVVCGSGYRSTIAASQLAASGFSKVYNLMGGMLAWEGRDCGCFEPADMVYGGGGI
jgi:glyoxylase-like metal-dependent hydrolase (beta-lactamase superfamily II)/rhodanese-related sulfurtransferase